MLRWAGGQARHTKLSASKLADGTDGEPPRKPKSPPIVHIVGSFSEGVGRHSDPRPTRICRLRGQSLLFATQRCWDRHVISRSGRDLLGAYRLAAIAAKDQQRGRRRRDQREQTGH